MNVGERSAINRRGFVGLLGLAGVGTVGTAFAPEHIGQPPRSKRPRRSPSQPS